MSTLRLLRLNPADDVAILLQDAAPGDRSDDVRALEAMSAGHKIAVSAIERGAAIRKYGQVIGFAKQDIPAGAHVHVHNVEIGSSTREAEIGTSLRTPPNTNGAEFDGYIRADGRVGTRNFIGVLTSVNCSATVARRVADHFTPERMSDYVNVDGVAAFTHMTGCGTPSTGEGVDNLNRTLAGYARHPNFAGLVIIGLGCEVNQIPRLLDEYGLSPGPMLQAFTIQDAGGTLKAIDRGVSIARELAQEANKARRERVSASHLMVGLQCGGSDGWSGVTANPSLGAASDLVVANGGTAILSETP